MGQERSEGGKTVRDREKAVGTEELTQHEERRGGKVTDGLGRIRGKSGWVSDGNSLRVLRDCSGKS